MRATAEQSLRELLPDGENVSAGQAEHISFVAPEIVEYVSLTQRAQEASPEELLYVPAVQAVHGPPSRPEEPEWHVQSLSLLLPDGDDDRVGQLKHVIAVVAPGVMEYLPLWQR